MRDAGVPGASVLCAGRGRRACARGRAADCDPNVVPCAGVAGPLSMRGRAQLPRTQLLGSGKRRGDPGAGLVEELKECDMITQSDKARRRCSTFPDSAC